MSLLGERVKRERERRGLSYRAADEEMGVHYSLIHHIERGAMPTLPNFYRAVVWLRLTPEQVMFLLKRMSK